MANKILGEIYARSVEQGYQTGDIFTVGDCKVIHHHCGFVFLTGDPTTRDLDELCNNVTHGRRAVLFSYENEITAYYRDHKGIATGRRSFYEYHGSDVVIPVVPEGAKLQELDDKLIAKLNGRIVPSFSWDDMNAFLSNGKGYCITYGDEVVAWAFSSGISDTELDIGVETDERYRGRGLSTIVAGAMTDYALKQGKTPVWACDVNNTGSAGVAEKVGFTKIGECDTILLNV